MADNGNGPEHEHAPAIGSILIEQDEQGRWSLHVQELSPGVAVAMLEWAKHYELHRLEEQEKEKPEWTP
jgi:hypothetical protein